MASEEHTTNAAFVFIKPHAVTEAVKTLAKSGLEAHGIKILAEGSIKAEEIDEKKLVDQHYYSIASKATILKPNQLNVKEAMFKEAFGIEWKEALDSGKVFNAMDGCAHLGINAEALDQAWAKAKAAKKLVKFGGGFYCGLVEIEDKEPVYIFNGFFMSMRSKFTTPGTEIYYYSVEWDTKALSWADFRGKVLGPTDPAEAPADSLRGEILAKWEELGLSEKPNVGDNGMHASASPFEGLAERVNWLGATVPKDSFGSRLLAAGVPQNLITDWCVDPQVTVAEDGSKGSIFDQLEDSDSAQCLDKMLTLARLNGAVQAPPAGAMEFSPAARVESAADGGGTEVTLTTEAATEGEKKKRKKKKVVQTVFESQPQQSKADVASGKQDSDQKEEKSTFESQPRKSVADVSAAAAAAAAAEQASPSTFESKPRQSVADFHAGGKYDAPQDNSVFESKPQDSKAAYSWKTQQAAAEASQSTWESKPQESKAFTGYGSKSDSPGEGPSTFESKPQNSKAQTRWDDKTESGQGPSVFESNPEQSKAVFGHGRQSVSDSQGPSVFESTPQESKAEVSSTKQAAAAESSGGPSVWESTPQQSRAEVGYGRQSVVESSAPSVFESKPSESKAEIKWNAQTETAEGPSVFESKPTESKANYKAGVNNESGSEYEDDEEDEA